MSEAVSKVTELFERSGIDPADVERIDRVNLWQAGHKNSDGEWETHDLAAVQVRPRVAEVDQDLFIRQAPPAVFSHIDLVPASRDTKVTVCMGDAQIGYRGQEAFHDERAMKLGLTAVRVVQPDEIVLTGDMVDLQSMSSFSQRPDWIGSTQQSIDTYHDFLAGLRANAPNAKISSVHGNHELRLDRYVRKNAAEVLGLRRANAEEELAVLTLQFLARYDDLEVNSVDGYPNAAYWLEDDLKVMHGWVAKKGGATAQSYLRSEDESTIFGHDHRLQVAHRTIPQRVGHRVMVAASPGCLAKVDGTVPGWGHSVDDRGQTVKRAQDWQNGLVVVEHSAEGHEVTPIRMAEVDDKLVMRLGGVAYEQS